MRSQAALRSLLAALQVVRNQYHKRQFMALSLLSPFLYLKTVASLHATLYNSGQHNAPCPGAFTQNLKTHERSLTGSQLGAIVLTMRGGVLASARISRRVSECQAENVHVN
jgi:hypothetical protein